MVLTFLVGMFIFGATDGLLDHRMRASILLLAIPVGIIANVWHQHSQTVGTTLSLQTMLLAYLGISTVLGGFIAINFRPLQNNVVPLWAILALVYTAPAMLFIAERFRKQRNGKKPDDR
jgi:hypothetical protein